VSENVVDWIENTPMEPLVTLQFYRRIDGSVWASVTAAEEDWIDSAGEDLPSRFLAIVDMLPAAKAALEDQARKARENHYD
jgi:hypothetical protein